MNGNEGRKNSNKDAITIVGMPSICDGESRVAGAIVEQKSYQEQELPSDIIFHDQLK